MSAAFLAATAGISPPTIEQSAAYLDNWCKALKGDKRLVVKAAGTAQKSADWILGTSFDEAATSTSSPQAETPKAQAEISPPERSQLRLF